VSNTTGKSAFMKAGLFCRRHYIIDPVGNRFPGDCVQHLPAPRIAPPAVGNDIFQADPPMGTNFMERNLALFQKLDKILARYAEKFAALWVVSSCVEGRIITPSPFCKRRTACRITR
jgi:hypothetical protein